jgi:hypothetical protein
MLKYDDERLCKNPAYPESGPAPQTYKNPNTTIGIAAMPGSEGIPNPLLPIVKAYMQNKTIPKAMPKSSFFKIAMGEGGSAGGKFADMDPYRPGEKLVGDATPINPPAPDATGIGAKPNDAPGAAGAANEGATVPVPKPAEDTAGHAGMDMGGMHVGMDMGGMHGGMDMGATPAPAATSAPEPAAAAPAAPAPEPAAPAPAAPAPEPAAPAPAAPAPKPASPFAGMAPKSGGSPKSPSKGSGRGSPKAGGRGRPSPKGKGTGGFPKLGGGFFRNGRWEEAEGNEVENVEAEA